MELEEWFVEEFLVRTALGEVDVTVLRFAGAGEFVVVLFCFDCAASILEELVFCACRCSSSFFKITQLWNIYVTSVAGISVECFTFCCTQ